MIQKSIGILFLCSSLWLQGKFTPQEGAKEAGECGKIVAGSIAAACIYGILNDQITVRVCPEYFTKGFHEKMVNRMPEGWIKSTLSTTKSHTILGLIWGVIATWWMGAALSLPVVIGARAPVINAPQLKMEDLIKPTGFALAFMGASSLAAGMIGYHKGADEDVQNYFKFAAQGVPEGSMQYFIADAYAHHAAYSSGVIATAGLIVWIMYERCKRNLLKKST